MAYGRQGLVVNIPMTEAAWSTLSMQGEDRDICRASRRGRMDLYLFSKLSLVVNAYSINMI